MKKLVLTKHLVNDIQDWIADLRSGEFQQGQLSLNPDPGSFCCLGVACKRFIDNDKLTFGNEGDDSLLYGDLPKDQKQSPKWLKLIDNDFKIRTSHNLSFLNDDGYEGDKNEHGEVVGERTGPLSFEEIADLLEAVYIHRVLG